MPGSQTRLSSRAVGGCGRQNGSRENGSSSAFENDGPRLPKYNKDLPVYQQITSITTTIAQNKVTVISGSTGCGKSTHIPLFIMDDFARNAPNKCCRILVAMPRRIAATSLADYVANFRGVHVGEEIGYMVGMGNVQMNQQTKIIYCTTGMLVNQLCHNPKGLSGFTHVFLDEIHERSEDMDFAMLIIKLALKEENARVPRIIIMSATMEVAKITDYFIDAHLFTKPAEITISGRDNYTTKEEYLEHFEIEFNRQPVWDVERPFLLEKLMDVILMDMNELDMRQAGRKRKGTVLIFLPGLEHIELMMEKIDNFLASDKICKFINWEKCPLHSLIPHAQQVAAFSRPKDYVRRLVLATNIAESSVTVPDVEIVYDFCLTKRMVTDEETRLSFLQMQWAAKSNCNQRKGRAGRVCDGMVYRMVPQSFYEKLESHPTPEMELVPITKSLLRLKRMLDHRPNSADLGTPIEIFAQAVSTQSPTKVKNAVLILKEKGALSLYNRGQLSDSDGDLTLLGDLCSFLPLDLPLTRLIFFGYSLGLIDDAITIACLISVRSVFSASWQGSNATWMAKRLNDGGYRSDCLVSFRIFREWAKLRKEGRFECTGSSENVSEREWCRQRSVLVSRLREVGYLIDEICRRLIKRGLYQENPNYIHTAFEANPRWTLLIKIAIAGAFYPNYLRSVASPKEVETLEDLDKAASESLVAVAGRDPLHCFIINIVASNTPAKAIMYFEEVRKFVSQKLESDVAFKIFTRGSDIVVAFEPSIEDAPGDSSRYVEMLVRLTTVWAMERHPYPMTFSAIDPNSEENLVTAYPKLSSPTKTNLASLPWLALSAGRRGHNIPKAVFPDVEDKKEYSIVITNNLDGLTVYVRFVDLSAAGAAKPSIEVVIGHILACPGSTVQKIDRRSVANRFVLARFTKAEYARAEVRCTARDFVEVFFIDHGKLAKVTLADVLLVSPPNHSQHCTLFWTTPALAIRCSMPKFYRYVGSPEDVVKLWPLNVPLTCTFSHKENDVVVLMDIRSSAPGEPVESLVAEAKRRGQLEVLTEKVNRPVPSTQIHEIPADRIAKEIIPTTGRIEFRPPHTPFEIRGVGAWSWTHSIGRARNVNVHCDSVNAVMLRSRLPDPVNTLLVCSGDVLVSRRGATFSGKLGSIIASDTTMMPHQPGMFCLLGAVFAPVVEIRYESSADPHPVGVYCGLGKSENGPMFERHDFLALTDGKLDENDIASIGLVRDLLNHIPVVGKSLKPGSAGTSDAQAAANELKVSRDEVVKQILNLFRADRAVELNSVAKFKADGIVATSMWSTPLPDILIEDLKNPAVRNCLFRKLQMQCKAALVDLDCVPAIPEDVELTVSEVSDTSDAVSLVDSEDSNAKMDSGCLDVGGLEINTTASPSVAASKTDEPVDEPIFNLTKEFFTDDTKNSGDTSEICADYDPTWGCLQFTAATSETPIRPTPTAEEPSEVVTAATTEGVSGKSLGFDFDGFLQFLDHQEEKAESRLGCSDGTSSTSDPPPTSSAAPALDSLLSDSVDKIWADLASISTSAPSVAAVEKNLVQDCMETTSGGDGTLLAASDGVEDDKSAAPESLEGLGEQDDDKESVSSNESAASFSTASEGSFVSVVENPAYILRRKSLLNNDG